MTGKILIVFLVVCTLAAGAGMYYLQVFHFYEDAPAQDGVVLTRADGETQDTLPVTNFEAIDASSSPIRFRACFDTDADPATLAGEFEVYDGAVPRTAPFWFGCFDAAEIGAAIDDGRATVLVGTRNREFGIDRVVAITQAGRGYIWHEINDCGDRAYDGTPLGDDCPPRP